LKLIYRLFYNFIFVPTVFILGFFVKKISAGAKEKFGFYNFKFKEEKTIWIHAVSVGEVMLAQTLIDKLNTKTPIVLTTSTPQGQELAKNKLSDKCKKITYFPYDTTFAIKNAIKAINPKMAIIMETEIWPNFAWQLKNKNIPLFIANGRISEATFNSYKKFKFFFKNVLSDYEAILTQTPQDKERFIEIGSNPDKTLCMGNIKFDLDKPDDFIKHKYQLEFNTIGKKVLIFGSTHGEENPLLISVFKNLKDKIDDLKLIIAPRHLEKIPQIERLLTLSNLKYSKRSEQGTFGNNDVVILDTTGELGKIYSIADVCIIGGSYDKTGGHNPLEATIWGKPVISGPNVKNFRYIFKNLCESNCALIANNKNELLDKTFELFSDKTYLNKINQNCVEVFNKNRGATEFLVNYLEKFDN